jgi:transcriptional regulator with XRE-family HTH domain
MQPEKEPKVSKSRAKRMRNIQRAREWRAKGYTFQEIADALHVSNMTAWDYCHDVPRGDIYKEIEK